MKTKILAFITILFFAGCLYSNTFTLYIAPYKVPCMGVAPMQCLQVKKDKEKEWELFYAQIKGFEFKEGYFYTLKIKEEEWKNPPADASSSIYTLIEIIEKKAITN